MSTTLILFVLFVTIFIIGITLSNKLKIHETYIETILDTLKIEDNLLKNTFCDKKSLINDFLNKKQNGIQPIIYDETTKKYNVNKSFCKS